MPRQDGPIQRELRRLFDEGTLTGLDDATLLDRFARHRDERAFEALVSRHGRMVLGVSRSVLHDPEGAEDAFQATFLILARKAATIHVDGSLGRWLHGVARRVARRASSQRSRLAARESGRLDPALASPAAASREYDRIATLHEEVGRLPEKYRAPIILCYLEGRTHEEAARLLRWPLGTVKGRLARARDRLRDRLTLRGFAPSTGLLGLGLFGDLAYSSPLVPAHLSRSTTQLALGFSGKSCLPAASISSSTALAKGVLKGMVIHKLKVAAAVFGLGALGAGVYAQNELGPRGENGLSTPSVPAATDEGSVETRLSTEIVELKAEAKSLRESLSQMEAAIDRAEKRLKRMQVRTMAPAENPRALAATPSRPETPATPRRPTPPEYIVEPPDLVAIKVYGTLPAEGLDGSHLVQPDGRMSLGPYGKVVASGFTMDELKERILDRLRVHFSEVQLGLRKEVDGRVIDVPPGDSVAISVDVAGYNSKFYYVQGNIAAPGRLPIRGTERVLDAINMAGGLNPRAGSPKIQLIRPAREPGSSAQILPIDLNAIVALGDQTTNYAIEPSDRIVVYKDNSADPDARRTAVVIPAEENHVTQDQPTRSTTMSPAAEKGNGRNINVAYPVADLVTKAGTVSSPEALDFAPLVEILRESVAPGTWKDPEAREDSPDKGSITPFFLNASLIVRHDREVHEQVVQRLRQIRRLRGLCIPQQETVPTPDPAENDEVK